MDEIVINEDIQRYVDKCQLSVGLLTTTDGCRIVGMEFKDRLRQAIKESGFSQREISRLMGVSPQAVSYWLNGRNPPERGKITKLSALLNKTPAWLEFGESTQTSESAQKDSNPPLPPKKGIIPSDSRIPLLSDEFKEGWGIFPYRSEGIMELLDSPEGASERAFGIRVRGRGMEPEFFENEIAIVDPALEVRSGDFVVVLLEGQKYALVRRLLVEPNQTRYLEGLHPVYGGSPLLLEESPRFIGKIIEKRKRY